MKRTAALAAAILVFSPAMPEIPAQDKPLPPPRDARADTARRAARLPSLTFPEFIITGADVVKLEDNFKETLDAFDASEFASRSGLGRREMRRDADLTAPPPLTLAQLAGSANNLLFRAGFGSYSTPELGVWFGNTFRTGDITAALNFRRSAGHAPLAGFERAALQLGGGSYFSPDAHALLARSRAQGELRLKYASYYCYGDPAAPEQELPDFRRRDMRVSYAGDLISRHNSKLDYRLRFFADHLALGEKITVRDSLILDKISFAENNFGLSAGVTRCIEGIPVDAGLFAAFSSNTASGLHAQSPLFVSLSARARHAFQRNLILDGTAALYIHRGSTGVTYGRLYPKLKLEYNIDEAITLFGGWQSRVERLTVSDLLDRNPYVPAGPEIRHRDAPIGLSFGLSYDDRESLWGKLAVEHNGYRNWGRLRRQQAPASRQWDIAYEGYTEITALRGELLWSTDPGGKLHCNLALRSGRNDALNTRVPFLPDVELTARYARSFVFPLYAALEAEFLGSRSTGVGGALPSHLLLHVSAEYRFTSNFGIYCELRNLTDRRYYVFPGYLERPLTLGGGITARF